VRTATAGPGGVSITTSTTGNATAAASTANGTAAISGASGTSGAVTTKPVLVTAPVSPAVAAAAAAATANGTAGEAAAALALCGSFCKSDADRILAVGGCLGRTSLWRLCVTH
jgi:hypothetical protein